MQTKENIINGVKSTWNKDLIIRYLIRELAPYFKRDLYYFLLTNKEQIEVFKQGFRPTMPNVFCISLCEYYQKIFEGFGIQSKIIQASDGNNNTRVPLYALIVEGDYSWYFINPLKDLCFHQLQISSSSYGVIDNEHYDYVMKDYPYLKTLEASYLKEIDNELGLKNNDELFRFDYIGGKDYKKYRLTKGIPFNAPIEEAIESKLRDISHFYANVGNVTGPIERIQAYKFFADRVFTNPERNRLKIGMNIEEDNALRIIINPDNNPITYQEEKDSEGLYRLRKK